MKDLSVIERELCAGEEEIPGARFSIPPNLNKMVSIPSPPPERREDGHGGRRRRLRSIVLPQQSSAVR